MEPSAATGGIEDVIALAEMEVQGTSAPPRETAVVVHRSDGRARTRLRKVASTSRDEAVMLSTMVDEGEEVVALDRPVVRKATRTSDVLAHHARVLAEGDWLCETCGFYNRSARPSCGQGGCPGFRPVGDFCWVRPCGGGEGLIKMEHLFVRQAD